MGDGMSARTYGHGSSFDGAAYYSTSDTIEHLDHESVEEALEDFLDDGGELPVRVFAWSRKPRPTTLSGEHIEAMFESIEEWWSEEYGDPEGGCPPWSDTVRAELEAELRSVLEGYLPKARVWQCDLAASAEFTEADARRLGIEVQP